MITCLINLLNFSQQLLHLPLLSPALLVTFSSPVSSISTSFSLTPVFFSPSPAVFPPQVFIKTWWRWVKPIIFRAREQPCLKSIGFLEKNKKQHKENREGGWRSGLLNIKQQVSGERGKSCGDAVSDPISISCSPARLQPWLHSDFYSTRQATSGTVTLFSSVISAVLYTHHDMMHLCLSYPWRGPS